MTALAAWAEFWQTLTPASIPRVRELCAPDVRFADPFNDLVGVDPLQAMLRHMFTTLEQPGFVVEDQAMGHDAGYLRWRFSARLGRHPLVIVGMSEIRFAPDGKVTLHRDHWDAGAQVYGRVPLLGAAIGMVRRRISLPAS
ncbi:MAG TPA: nuclear transport factor 2 family protein [Rhodospirillaceae bacterium]|nr:nuclear transport factor 2 family protein [Rhodospirillaceae bacterium]